MKAIMDGRCIEKLGWILVSVLLVSLSPWSVARDRTAGVFAMRGVIESYSLNHMTITLKNETRRTVANPVQIFANEDLMIDFSSLTEGMSVTLYSKTRSQDSDIVRIVAHLSQKVLKKLKS